MSKFVTSQPHCILNVYPRGNTDTDAVHPKTTEKGSPIVVIEPEDGENVHMMQLKSFMLWESTADAKRRKLLYSCDKSEFYITNARLALACDNYDKGESIVGDSLVTGSVGFGVVNGLLSKATHRALAHGSILAGHVRYRNLRSIRGRQKYSLTSANEMCITAMVKADGIMYQQDLEMVLARDDDPLQYLAELYRRIGAYKLAHEMDENESETRRLQKMRLLIGIRPPADPKTYSGGGVGPYAAIQVRLAYLCLRRGRPCAYGTLAGAVDARW